MVKIDEAGTLLWQKSFGGTYPDVATSITSTPDGGYTVAGYSISTDGDVTGNHGSWDYWVVKIDAVGNLLWQKALGGSNTDIANSITASRDGSLVVAGESSSNNGNVTGNHGAQDFWVVKLNSAGAWYGRIHWEAVPTTRPHRLSSVRTGATWWLDPSAPTTRTR